MPDRRLTQEPVEVAEQGTADPRRLTQLVVESAEQVTGASLMRRWTQLVVEVAITQPVMPFGMPEFVPEPEWSPAYIVTPADDPAAAHSSYWGVHNKEIVLGQRGTRSVFVRR